MPRFRLASMIALLLSASPLGAQESQAPPAVERLEQLRFDRLREALGLGEEEARALRQRLEASHRQHREAMAAEREAARQLREELARNPVDQEAVRRALEAMEAQRGAMALQREALRREIEQRLSPEQRAKFLLFNEQFNDRLRDLIARRRAPRTGLAPGDRQIGRSPGARRGEDPARLRRRIEELERFQQELRRRLEEMEKDPR